MPISQQAIDSLKALQTGYNAPGGFGQMLSGRAAQESQLDEMKRNLAIEQQMRGGGSQLPPTDPQNPRVFPNQYRTTNLPGGPVGVSGATQPDVEALQSSMDESPSFGKEAQARGQAIDLSNLKGILGGFTGGAVQRDPTQPPASLTNESPKYISKPTPSPGQQAAISGRQMETEKIQAPVTSEMYRTAGGMIGQETKGEQALALARERQTAQNEMLQMLFLQHPELIGKVNIPGMIGFSPAGPGVTGGAQKLLEDQLLKDRNSRQALEGGFSAFGQSLRGNLGGNTLEMEKARLDKAIADAEQQLRIPSQASAGPTGGTPSGRQIVGTGPFHVVHPNGKEYRFNTQAKMDTFKQQFNIP